MFLIHVSPHQVSLRAVTHVDMLVLSKEDLDGVLIHDESVALQVHEVAERLYPNLFPSKTNWSVYIKQTIRCCLNFNEGYIWYLFFKCRSTRLTLLLNVSLFSEHFFYKLLGFILQICYWKHYCFILISISLLLDFVLPNMNKK